jgi:hypothetical protein
MPSKKKPPKITSVEDLVKRSRVAQQPRPLKVNKHTIRPLGPKRFRLGSAPGEVGYGPGEPPPGFLNQWNSREEWLIYWAVCKVKNTPRDCRQPPFVGGGEGSWTYQNPDPVYGGRVAGGQVYDIILWTSPRRKIALRIQTERFHIFASSLQQAKDLYLKTQARGVDDVFDIYSQNYTGKGPQALIMAIVRAMKGIRELDPIRAGTGIRVRP